jgi:hypothetical protein
LAKKAFLLDRAMVIAILLRFAAPAPVVAQALGHPCHNHQLGPAEAGTPEAAATATTGSDRTGSQAEEHMTVDHQASTSIKPHRS